MKKMKKSIKSPHWYKLYLGSCPICGKDKSYRERIYGKRPGNYEDRIIYLPDVDTYDYCE